jgi:hypothetical protein
VAVRGEARKRLAASVCCTSKSALRTEKVVQVAGQVELVHPVDLQANMRSILVAMTKPFSCSPLIFLVCSETRRNAPTEADIRMMSFCFREFTNLLNTPGNCEGGRSARCGELPPAIASLGPVRERAQLPRARVEEFLRDMEYRFCQQ